MHVNQSLLGWVVLEVAAFRLDAGMKMSYTAWLSFQ